MDIAALAANPAFGVTPAAPQRGFDELASEDFFKLIITDLLNQDPLEPMDNEKLLQQLSSIRDMEMNQQITASLKTLAGQQRSGAATGLIGKLVEGSQGPGGARLSGVVTGVQFDANGAALLRLGPALSLPLSEVSEVTSLDFLEDTLLHASVVAAVPRDGQLQEIHGTVMGLKVRGGQVELELDSGEVVPHTSVTRVTAGAAGDRSASGTGHALLTGLSNLITRGLQALG